MMASVHMANGAAFLRRPVCLGMKLMLCKEVLCVQEIYSPNDQWFHIRGSARDGRLWHVRLCVVGTREPLSVLQANCGSAGPNDSAQTRWCRGMSANHRETASLTVSVEWRLPSDEATSTEG